MRYYLVFWPIKCVRYAERQSRDKQLKFKELSNLPKCSFKHTLLFLRKLNNLKSFSLQLQFL